MNLGFTSRHARLQTPVSPTPALISKRPGGQALPHRRNLVLLPPLAATNVDDTRLGTEQGQSEQSTQGTPQASGLGPLNSLPVPLQEWQAAEWDLDCYHYAPKWFRPPILILAGVSFVVGCNLGAKVGLETTAIASVPVLVAWFIAFYVVPKQFRVFARKYLRTHPEAWEKALQEALERQQETGQFQDRRTRQQ